MYKYMNGYESLINSESEKRAQLLKTILDSSPNCIYVKDKQGRYIIANKAIADLYQTTPDEMIGKKDEDFADQAVLKPNEAAFFKDIDKKTIEKKETQIIACESFTYDDGTTHYFFTTKKPITYEGDPDCVIGISVDITKLKETEKQVFESKIKFQDIFNNSTVGYSLTKPDGTLSKVNKAFASMLGYTVEELAQKNFEDITHPEDIAESKKCVKSLLSGTRNIYQFEKRYYHKNGSIVWTDVSTTLMKDMDYNPLFFITSIQDITEKKKAEDEIRQSEKKYHTLFDTMAQGVVYQDTNGKIISANPAAERILGVTLSQMQGRTSMDPRWKAVDKDKNILPGDKHPAMIALKTGEEVANFLQGVFNPEKNDYVWIIVNSIPLFKEDSTTPYQVFSTFLDVTKRIKMEEENKNLALFPSQNPNPVIRVTNEGKVIYANEAGLKLLESKNVSIGNFIPKSKLDYVKRIFAMNENRKRTFHYGGRTFLLSLNPIKHKGYINIYGQDITEKEHVLTRLKQSKDEIDMLLNAAGDGIRVVTKDFKIKMMNDTFAEMVGMVKEEVRDRYCYDVFKCDDCGTENCAMRKVVRTGDGFETETTRTTLDNREMPCILRVSPYWDDHGEIIGIVEDYRDITSLKKVQNELKNSEEKYRSYISNAPNGVFICDEKGKYVEVNNKAVEITGYSRDELLNMSISDITAEEGKEQALQHFQMLLKEGKSFGESLFIHKDGSIHWWQVNAVRLSENRFLGFTQDITNKKITEEKLKKTYNELQMVNKNLEHKVEERTQKIQEILLQKDEMINQLGHDLKNPLGPIINLVPILIKKETDPKKLELLNAILRSSEYMKNLVIKSIQLAKLNASIIEFDFEEINLRELCQDVLDSNLLMFKENSVSFENRIKDDLVLNADRLQLQEVFNNLFNNAVKYTEGDGLITINAYDLGTTVEVSITDEGIGMTEEQINKIFNEFYKADVSRHDFDSSGLGMSICKKIIEKHNGNIWAESKGIGKGSAIKFTLKKEHNIK